MHSTDIDRLLWSCSRLQSSSVVAHNSFYRILTGVGLSHDSLLLGYPDPVIPVPRPSVLEQTALHRLERLAPLSPQNAIDPVPTKTVADVFTLGDMNVGMGSRYRAPDIGKRWWTCDLKRENKSVSCVDAEEMMACGRVSTLSSHPNVVFNTHAHSRLFFIRSLVPQRPLLLRK